jgi:hypothetical protein
MTCTGGYTASANVSASFTSTSTTGNGTPTTSGCFTAGTQIEMADGSFKAIQDVKVGDSLRSALGGISRVEKRFIIKHSGLKFSFNGGKFFTTSSHPFLTESGWKSLEPSISAKENPGLKVTLFKAGDVILTKNGSLRIHTVESVMNDERVYNFKTDGDHTYLADGYKVHNVASKTGTGTTTILIQGM